MVAFVACSSSASSQTAATIKVDGSTALQPLVAQAAADYMAKNPGVTIDVAGGGSAKGIFDASNHTVDIGDSDVPASSMDLSDHEVAVAAFAVVTGPNTGVTSLTKAQIASIFSGAVKNWKALGGHDQPVFVVNRALGSGTRRVFTTYMMAGKEPAQIGTSIDTSEEVAKAVKNQAGAISYVSLSFAQKYTMPTVAIAGIAPSIAHIRSGQYGFWSYEHMYTGKQSSPATEAFIASVKDDNAAIDQLGFVALKDLAKR
jgi:phosphate transport system substrate-binding protein